MTFQLYLLSLCMTTDNLLGVKSNFDNLTFSYHEKIVKRENLQDVILHQGIVQIATNENLQIAKPIYGRGRQCQSEK